MNIRRFVPGIVMAASLCVVPCARAISITQTGSSSTSGSAISFASFSGAGNVIYSNYNEPGTLSSVLVEVHMTLLATVNERNVFNMPVSYTPTIYWQPFVRLISSNNLFLESPTLYRESVGQAIVLAPNAFATYTASLNADFTYQFTSAADLANFLGPGNGRVFSGGLVYGPSFAGSVSGTVTTNSTVTFTYNAPDTGYTVGLFAAAFFSIGVGAHAYQRKSRSQPPI